MPFEQLIPRRLLPVAVQMYAPRTSGVYGISNAEEWVYIGETDDIQGALMDHLSQSDSAAMKRQPTGFVFEVCDAASRASRQSRLVSEYEPCCNHSLLPRR
jgi:predicted GIY-YIG superfamily endonuclease